MYNLIILRFYSIEIPNYLLLLFVIGKLRVDKFTVLFFFELTKSSIIKNE